MTKISIVLTTVTLLTLVACTNGSNNTKPQLSFPTATLHDFNAAVFDENSANITNPYLNFTVGRKSVFTGQTKEGFERREVVVLPEIRLVNGIQSAIVLDSVTINGLLVKETRDWYAQDTLGRVWTMGEEVGDFEDGALISTSGSWEAGRDILGSGFTATAGIQMFATPPLGAVYYQQFYQSEAEDSAQIIDVSALVDLADGQRYTAFKIKEWVPLNPTGYAFKYYVENIGLVLETDDEGSERIELVQVLN